MFAAKEKYEMEHEDRSIIKRHVSFKEGLTHRKFYHLAIMLYCSTFYGMYMSSAYKNFGSKKGNIDDFTLTLAGAFGSICNGFSRIFWASLQDHHGFKKMYAILLLI